MKELFVALPMSADSAPYADEELPLHAALRERGLRFATPIWDDPAVDWAAFDAVLIRTTWDYVEKIDAFERWLARADVATRLFNPLPLVRWNLRKRYLAALQSEGVPCIETVWIHPDAPIDLPAVLAKMGWARAFLKPELGATSSGTLRFDANTEGLARARAHLTETLPRSAMMLQPYLDAVEREGELSLMFFDGAFSHAFRKVPVPGDYRVQREHNATDHAVTAAPDEIALSTRVIQTATRLTGEAPLYARVDLLRDGGGALRLTELEMVEPSLFLHHAEGGAARLVDALLRRIG